MEKASLRYNPMKGKQMEKQRLDLMAATKCRSLNATVPKLFRKLNFER